MAVAASVLCLGLAAAAPATAAAPAATPSAQPAAVAGELVVRYEPGSDRAERAATRRRAGVRAVRGLGLAGTQLVEASGAPAAAALAALRADDHVRYAERNLIRRPAATPNDPLFAELWGLHNSGQSVAGVAGTADADIDAPEAWDAAPAWGPGATDAEVVVAVLDTGADLGHADLAAGLWTNPGETPGNGVDDDGNGYVDDIHGYDFAGADADAAGDDDPHPDDGDGHGTHVSGTIMATADNGEGVAGVAPRASLMALKVCAPDSEGEVACPLADLVEAYGYAVDNGARAVNGSLGGPDFSRAEKELLGESPQTLFVFAAGNEEADNNAVPSYPCSLDQRSGYDADNLICVAATDQDDRLAGFSNFGADSVDLGAPGTRILSTYPEALVNLKKYLPYAYMSGTSMATPHVTGAAALLFSLRPSLSVAEAKAAILGSAEARPSLSGKTVSGGRLNARLALDSLPEEAPAEPEPDPEPEPETQPQPETAPETAPAPIPMPPAATPAAPLVADATVVAPATRASAPRAAFARRPGRVVRTGRGFAWGRFRLRQAREGVAFRCKFDRRPYRRCGGRFARRFRLGRHAVRVRAVDRATGLAGRPVVLRFRVKRVR